jgi:hypothetical protein
MLAVGLLVAGARQTYQVFPDPDLPVELPPVSIPDFTQPSFAPPKAVEPPPPKPTEYLINDLRMVENTTFTGVAKKDGKLWFTYDASAKRGKRSCPT